jgi:hypothetical protein
VDYYLLENIRGYGQAEEFFNSGLYIDAFNSYLDVDRYIRDNTGYRYKKSDLKRLEKKCKTSFEKADSLSNILITYKGVRVIEEKISARKEEEKNEIIASLKTQNMDFYRPYQAGAINNLSGILVSDVMQKNNDRRYFDPERFTGYNGSSDRQEYYLNYRRDSVYSGINGLLEKCLEENRNLLLISQQFEAKTKQIEELNLTTKTKFIYVTYTAVMDDFKRRYTEERNFNDRRPIDDYVKLITLLNMSLDKIIALYNGEPKTMDKELKKVANSHKAKNELLFPLLSFYTDGALEGLYDL